jgi:hypothetical protein
VLVELYTKTSLQSGTAVANETLAQEQVLKDAFSMQKTE